MSPSTTSRRSGGHAYHVSLAALLSATVSILVFLWTVLGRDERVMIAVDDSYLTVRLTLPHDKSGPLVILVPPNGSYHAGAYPQSRTDYPFEYEVLASSFAGLGIATLWSEGGRPLAAAIPDVDTQARELVAEILYARNSRSFSSISLIALGGPANAAAVAAQAARADSLVIVRESRANPSNPAGLGGVTPRLADDDSIQLGKHVRLRIPVLEIDSRIPQAKAGFTWSAADTAQAVATFIKTQRFPRHPGVRRSKREVGQATIRGAHLTVEYGQPAQRGRDVWNNVVPWNSVWMPGADESTTFTTSVPLIVSGLYVPAGDYTLYTITGELFQLVINRQLGQFHLTYDNRLDLGRVAMAAEKPEFSMDLLTFTLTETADGGEIGISWGGRRYSAQFLVCNNENLPRCQPSEAGSVQRRTQRN